jgi:RNA polymerase subunit RPABC4/transcription elongation factor Spt4
MNADENDSFTCPNCGAEVPSKAKVCPECGSDEKTGWSENTIYDGTDIVDPDEDDFNYEDWRRRESGGGKRRSPREWLWWVIAVAVLVAFLLFFIRW